jgi:hypothetical protein
MKYLHVASHSDSKDSPINLGGIIAGLTLNCLFSIIGGFRQINFGLPTTYEEALRINYYKEMILKPVQARLFTDSGGYSIIKGDIHPDDIRKLIKCYATFAECERGNFEFIFSLDIPFSKLYPTMNSSARLCDLNKEALTDLRELLEKFPELKNKVYFVWHFKMASQFRIWTRLYRELGLDKVIRHRAIGGMVGMREVTKISYSPFTPMAFRCLHDYLAAGDYSSEFRLHFLGMYIRYDRFQIALLEHLFRYYLKDIADVEMSYDSINYSHTARMNNIGTVYELSGDDLMEHPGVQNVPHELMKRVYGTDLMVLDLVAEEIHRQRRGDRLDEAGVFSPMNIYSNMCLDRFFERIIEEYGLVKVIFSSGTATVLNGKVNAILSDLKNRYGSIFTANMIKSIKANLEIVFIYHNWFCGKRARSVFEDQLAAFIRQVGFPDMIQ